MKTPEKKVKDAVTAILKSYGVYYFYPVTGGFGISGVPDIVACYKGQFIGIECKAGNNKPTALQVKALTSIDSAGGIALVINEMNVDYVETTLREIDRENRNGNH